MGCYIFLVKYKKKFILNFFYLHNENSKKKIHVVRLWFSILTFYLFPFFLFICDDEDTTRKLTYLYDKPPPNCFKSVLGFLDRKETCYVWMEKGLDTKGRFFNLSFSSKHFKAEFEISPYHTNIMPVVIFLALQKLKCQKYVHMSHIVLCKS